MTEKMGEISIIALPNGNYDIKDATARATFSDYVPNSAKGANSGVATLDANGKVPSSQLPSYVDDVVEYAGSANFPATGETGKIYVDTTTNEIYRWSGSTYIAISSGSGGGIPGDTVTAISTTANAGSSSSYSRADHVHNISLATGDNNGQVKIAGTNVSVYGLDAAAWKDVDTSITSVNSTKLPTSEAVVDYIEDQQEVAICDDTDILDFTNAKIWIDISV